MLVEEKGVEVQDEVQRWCYVSVVVLEEPDVKELAVLDMVCFEGHCHCS